MDLIIVYCIITIVQLIVVALLGVLGLTSILIGNIPQCTEI